MKILIVCPRLCHGGAERVAVTLAKGFIQRGHQVVFLTDLFEEQTYQLDEGIILQNLVDTPHPKWKKWISAIKNVRRQIKKNRPNVIIGIMPLCSIVARVAVIGTGVPVIATEHNSYERPHGVRFSHFEKVYKFYLTRLFPVVTVLTETDKQLLNNKRNVVVMPNPLVLEPIKTRNQKENVILAAGRVDNWHVKGFDILLQAWSKIISNEQLEINNYDYSQDGKPNHWWLKIAGVWRGEDTIPFLTGLIPDGEWVFNDNDKHSNTKNTEEKGIDTDKLDSQKCGVWRSGKYRIEFLGFQKDMESLYKKSGIFVLSSRYEGFGLVLIEAMSQGCACIACDYKGRQAEILSPSGDERRKTKDEKSGIEVTENGILCEPDNVEALAEAIKKMIEDDEYRENIRKNAIERSKYYAIEHTMERWEILLNNIINQ